MKRRRFLTLMGGVLVLSVGLVLANYGGGVTPATAAEKDNHTLPWDTNNLPASRFTVDGFCGAAVLDKNTGLVWEQAPDPALGTFDQATSRCANRRTGGTQGWRLPSVVELMSLMDPTSPAPFVPAVFSLTNVVPEAYYWSATEYNVISGSSGSAWYMGVGPTGSSA